MDSYARKAVKFQHRVATGHSILGPQKEVESKDAESGEVTKTILRHYKPVPTELVVDDALVLAAPPTQDGSAPRVMLIHLNGNPLMGADWHNAASMEVDVPHREHEGAEESERFYFDPNEDIASYVDGSEKRSAAQCERIRDLTLENALLNEQLAQTTEAKDAALQKLADENASQPSSTLPAAFGPSLITTETKQYSDGSSATGPAPLPDQSPAQQDAAAAAAAPVAEPDVATLLDAAPPAPVVPEPSQDSDSNSSAD
jgi:hypothetical protein